MSAHADQVTPVPNDIFAILDARTSALMVKECAELLGINERTLYRQAKLGKFPAFTVCGSMRVNPATLVDHLKSTSNVSDAPHRSAAIA